MAEKEATRRASPYDSLAEGVIKPGHLKWHLRFGGEKGGLGFRIKQYGGTLKEINNLFEDVPETAKARFLITAIQKEKPFLQYTTDQKLIVKKPFFLLRWVSTALGYPYARIRVEAKHKKMLEKELGREWMKIKARKIPEKTALKILARILEPSEPVSAETREFAGVLKPVRETR